MLYKSIFFLLEYSSLITNTFYSIQVIFLFDYLCGKIFTNFQTQFLLKKIVTRVSYLRKNHKIIEGIVFRSLTILVLILMILDL